MIRGIHSTVQSLGEVLGGQQRIRIPQFQRPFSWRSEHISRLWEDLQVSAEDDDLDKTMFIGSIVFSEDGGETFLVDGQQRLATVSLILAALRHRLKVITPEQHERGALIAKLEEMLFLDGDPSGTVRLELSERDGLAFGGLVKNGKVSNPPSSLRRAWRIVNDQLDDVAAETDLTDFGRKLYGLVKTTVGVSVVVVRPPQNPFAVFEALNSTGQDLAQSELIKNRVLQSARAEIRRDLNRQWERMVDILPEDEVTNYLRGWWAAQFEFVSAKKLYTAVRKEIKTPAQSEEFVSRWHDDAKYYTWLFEGAGESLRPNVQTALWEFSELGFRQGRPIVLSFLMRRYYSSIPEVVALLSRIFVRVLKSAEVRGSKFESRIERVCQAIRDSEEVGLERLRSETSSLCEYAGNLDWSNLVVEDAGFARYLLRKLNGSLEGKTREIPSTAVVEVEHILPKTKAEGQLSDLSDEDYGRWVSHIGNLTLILKTDQARCSNKPFEEKRAIYLEYGPTGEKPLRLTSDLGQFKKWGQGEILARAEALAKVGASIW